MAFKKGNTYYLEMPVKINGETLQIENVEKVVFQIGEIRKEYPGEDVKYERELFVVYLSQEDTLKLNKDIEYEVAIKFSDGQVIRSEPKTTYSIKTIINEEI